ncbi:hypothetical protein SAMN02745146_0437 [Hymenobacter daecheongensis DSM 21074]|uniref:STAS/SEC14 domain-containing protein n=1 Tax=Hymenobacter daecheongensis DSM 21074 TaxID=1121955 RepID=A0A1M6A0T9_9BACT|nr:hypothetical protein [Hymenobacter daecheongensis]SHI30075.1 hypothetical protein SAMN02745146_0437 [Hymenobacter daecheongensis DSM 21074]
MPALTLPVADFMELTFRPDAGTLLGRWHRPVSEPEVQQGYEATLAAATAHRSRYWLLDLRRRGPISEDSTHWVLEAFLPRLASLLGGRVYVAFLMSPGHLSAVDQENGAPLVASAACHVRLFTDEGNATEWLLRRQRHEGQA